MGKKMFFRSQGGTNILSFSNDILALNNCSPTTELELEIDNGRFILTPTSKKRYSIEELLVGAELLKELQDNTNWLKESNPLGKELF